MNLPTEELPCCAVVRTTPALAFRRPEGRARLRSLLSHRRSSCQAAVLRWRRALAEGAWRNVSLETSPLGVGCCA
jgi:hypothetical protein